MERKPPSFETRPLGAALDEGLGRAHHCQDHCGSCGPRADGLIQIAQSRSAVLHITLTYEGKIRGNSRKIAHVSSLRQIFSAQLAKLINTEPFSYVREHIDPNPNPATFFIGKQVGAFTFIPFISEKMHTTCSLNIKLLRGMSPHNPVLESVNLYNRIKTLIDSLRAPAQESELDKNCTEDPTYVLLEDDRLVTGLSVSTDHYLAHDDGETVFALITADIHLGRATFDNLHLGF